MTNTISGIPFLAAPSTTPEVEAEPEASPIDREIRSNRVRFEARVSDLREDPDLSDEAKRRHIEAEYQNARSRHEQLAAEKRAAIAERLEAARRAAFAPPRLRDADPAAAQLNFRDAIYRVRGVRDAAELGQILEEAELVGDEALAKAAGLIRGYALGSEKLVGAYLEGRPAARRQWDEFMGVAQEANALESVEGRLLGDAAAPRKPREIGGEW